MLKQPSERILFVTRKWRPAVGGMETYSHRLTQELERFAQVETIALAGRDDGSPPRLGALVVFMGKVFMQLLVQRRAAAVVHLGDIVLWPLGIAARLRSRTSRIVLSAHGTDVAFHRRGGLKGRAYEGYLRLGATLLDGSTVIANSRATRDAAAETGWSPSEVVPLATDVTGRDPTGKHEGYLLFVGRLVERKGCAWFIRQVLPLLPDTIRLRVAGTSWDADERQALDHPRVDFMGSLQGEELATAYREALCVVVPNIVPKSGEYEGFGLVAPEAAAAGGVVLASRTGGLAEAVDDGITGFLVPPGEPHEWSKAIGEVSEWNPERRRVFLARSMTRCREHYSWARVARETYTAYGLATSPPAPPPEF